MKNIIKKDEPRSLTEHRCSNLSDYEGYRGKEELRVSLCTEQRGNCCYCMGRIRPIVGSMKIEHWQSHEHYPNQRLVYANLLGACMGGEGFRPKDQHCDTYKGDRDLCKNPASPIHHIEALIQYDLSDGSIESIDHLFNDHLNTVLNLNMARLKANRKATLDGFKRFLALRPGKLSKAEWQQFLDEWDGTTVEGDLRPYAGVVTYWIRKHLV